MSRLYFDTIAILKHYHSEVGTTDVDLIFAAPTNVICTSRLALVEAHSAFSRRIRDGEMTSADSAQAIAGINNDIGSERIKLLALSSKRLTDAIGIFGLHGANVSLRTLDAIHLATAQAIAKRRRSIVFS
jgi:predicted nucleic acid-binding protein